MKLVITNGGPHPADKWAEITASEIVSVSNDIAPDKSLAAQKLRIAVTEALLRQYEADMQAERVRLADGKPEPDYALSVAAAMAAVRECAKGTPWEDHYKQPTVARVIENILARHFAHARQIERDWHDARNGAAA